MKFIIKGSHDILRFEYLTGQACSQVLHLSMDNLYC
jgi:hypothetical protein